MSTKESPSAPQENLNEQNLEVVKDALALALTEIDRLKMYGRDRFVRDLFLGEIPPSYKINDIYELYDLHFPSEYFLSVLVHIVGEEDASHIDSIDISPFDDQISELQAAIFTLIRSSLHNIAEAYSVFVRGSFIILLSLRDSDASDSSEYSQRFLSQIQPDAEKIICGLEKQGIVIKTTWSKIYKGIDSLRKSMEETRSLVEYLPPSQRPSIMTIYDASQLSSAKSDTLFRIESDHKFYNIVSSRDFQAAANFLLNSVETDLTTPLMTFNWIKNNLRHRIDFIISSLGIGWNTTDPDTLNILRSYLEIRGCGNSNELKIATTDFCRELCNYWENYTQGNNARAALIVEYIDQNYTDPSLNATKICECFNISSAHLSRIFKQQTNFGVVEYISYRRISAAKELMNTTSNLDSIAQQVGYYSRRTFTTAFKRLEGISPSEYRKFSKKV